MTAAEMARIHAAAFTRQRPWSAGEFEGYLDDRTTRLVARDAGFALLRLIPPEAEVLTLAVDPAVQRKGIGRALVEEMAAVAREGGADRLLLDVAAGNAPARALYAATGFTVTGRRPGYYRYPDGGSDDAVLMARDL